MKAKRLELPPFAVLLYAALRVDASGSQDQVGEGIIELNSFAKSSSVSSQASARDAAAPKHKGYEKRGHHRGRRRH